MNEVQSYEKKQALETLSDMQKFLTTSGTHVELFEKTVIGEKYTAKNGNDKKEIYLTRGNTVITTFNQDRYVSRAVVFHEMADVKSKIGAISAVLKKLASEKSLATKIEYNLEQIGIELKQEFQGNKR